MTERGHKPRLNHPLVQRSYESMLDAAARIATFSFSEMPNMATDLSTRAHALIQDDLIVFALSARRLFESTNSVDLARSAKVPVLGVSNPYPDFDFEKVDEISIWRLLGVLIHSDYLEVLLSEFELILWLDVDADYSRVVEDMKSNQKLIAPLLFTRSDREKFALYPLRDFIQIFDEKLDEVLDRCAVDRLYLGSFHGL